ncbi:MAG: SDR family oxidoreductase [Caldilineae bacterium]|nr:MAG: SDR family oxidoreductase [Caldilineae bacterium]
MMKLRDRVALITGAGSGIGEATAWRMATEGAHIAVVGIPQEGVERVAAALNEAGHQALAIPTDVSQAEQVAAAVEQTVAHFGRLDILVANAGIQLHDQDRDLHTLPEEVWDRTHAVNYRGVFLTLKYGLAQMVKQGEGGAVVIVSSVTAFSGRSPNVAYLSGKHGLIGLNRYVAVHYAKNGIRCNAVCPGALERTPMHHIHPDPEGRRARMVAQIPLGRLGKPEEIAPFITFLCTDEASYATGAAYLVDGGMTAA